MIARFGYENIFSSKSLLNITECLVDEGVDVEQLQKDNPHIRVIGGIK